MKKLLLPVLILNICLNLLACAQEKPTYTILIKGAQVLDGLGNEAILTDLAILEDKIGFIGDSEAAGIQAEKVIDASGYILSPGFVDVHTHSLGDLLSTSKNSNLNYLMQGVTTVVTGNDGGGPLNIGETLAHFDQQGIGTNAVLLTGQGSLRKKVMGMSDAEPSPDQMKEMKKQLIQAMDEGAFGMSTGLYYTPGNFAKTEEVVELAKVVAERGGIYDSHIRDESSYSLGLEASVQEVIEIARQSGIRANISHIKALGVDVWGQSEQIVALIEKARQEGLQITADQYPYRASGTNLANALVSRWVFAEDFKANMNNPELLPRIREEMKDNLRRRGGADALLFTEAIKPELYGKTLQEVADLRKEPVMTAAIDIIMNGGSGVASFNMNPEDIARFMKQSWVMTSSDGSTGHPRKYGSFPKKIREYVLEKGVLSLEEMVLKSSSLPASTFQIPQRGVIQEGYYADLILFKPEEVRDEANFQEPEKLAKGMHYVIVNGKIVVEAGEYRGTLAGKALRWGK